MRVREYRFDDFQADTGKQAVRRSGEPVDLAPRLLQILFLLLERHPDMVSREELRQVLWPDSVVEEGALAQNIYLLRKALGRRPDGGEYIQTIPKQGYRFLGEVRRCEGETRTEPEIRPEAAAGARPRWSGWGIVTAGIVLAVLAAGVVMPALRPRAAVHQPAPEARRFYEQGRAILKQRRPSGNAETSLRRAIELDPDYADAYAALAEDLATDSPPATRAQELIGRALVRFPGSAPVHAVAGFTAMVHRWDWPAAEAHFRRAIELDPRNAQAHQWYALWLAEMGRPLEAAQMIDAALREDPASPNLLTDRCSLLYYQRRLPEAAAACRQALEVEPAYHFAHDFLLRIHLLDGDRDRAVHHAVLRFERGEFSEYSVLEATLRGAADSGGVQAVARTILDRKWFGADDFYVALLQGYLGEREAALQSLEAVVNQHQFFSIFVTMDPAFDCLRGDPRFQALRRRMGLPVAN